MRRVGFYHVPGRIALHVWWPGRFSLLIGDKTMGIRVGVVVCGRRVFSWRSS